MPGSRWDPPGYLPCPPDSGCELHNWPAYADSHSHPSDSWWLTERKPSTVRRCR